MPKKKKDPDPPNGFFIGLDIWKCGVLVTWERDLQKIMKYGKHYGVRFSKDWQETFIEHQKGANGVCTSLGHASDMLVWLKVRPRRQSHFATLYHELAHAAHLIAEYRGFMREKEAFAYTYERLSTVSNRELWPKEREKK